MLSLEKIRQKCLLKIHFVQWKCEMLNESNWFRDKNLSLPWVQTFFVFIPIANLKHDHLSKLSQEHQRQKTSKLWRQMSPGQQEKNVSAKPLLQFNMRRKIAVCLWSCQLDCFPFQLRLFFLCRNSCSSARLSLNLSSISGGQFRSSLVFINYRKQASLHHILPRHWACG